MDDLVAAFTKIMHRVTASAAPIVERQVRMDRFTVRDKIKDIRTRLGQLESINFFALFEVDFTKSEIINTFLAILELLKTQEIKAVQQDAFSDIVIIKQEAHLHGGEHGEIDGLEYSVVDATD